MWAETINYSFDIHSEKPIENEEFFLYLRDMFERKDVVSIWEEHNHNSDKSFEEVQEYDVYIFHLFREIKNGGEFVEAFNRMDGEIQWYPEELEKWKKFKEFILQFFSQEWDVSQSSSRVMARSVIPTARTSAYTDIIIEWFSENNPRENYNFSTDKTWYLLLMLSAMINNIHIHWAYDKTPIVWVFRIAQKFTSRIDKIKGQDPDAKVLTYNWAFHNMTVPMKWKQNLFGAELDYEDLTFAPELHEKYGDRYLSCDIVDGWSQTEKDSHFAVLKWKALDWRINIVRHSEWQEAIVLPKSWIDVAGKMSKILTDT